MDPKHSPKHSLSSVMSNERHIVDSRKSALFKERQASTKSQACVVCLLDTVYTRYDAEVVAHGCRYLQCGSASV